MSEEPKILKMSAKSTISIDALFGQKTNSCTATEKKPEEKKSDEKND